MKLSKAFPVLSISATLLFFLFSCVGFPVETSGAARGDEPRSIAVVPESTRGDGGRSASIEVRTDPEGAVVFLGYRRVGETPLTLDDLEPGPYTIRVEKSGYYPEERFVSLDRGESLVLDLDLDEITGFLDVQANVAGVIVILNGTTYSDGFIELPVGTYEVRIRRFGYEDQLANVVIEREAQTQLDVTLLPAAFAITDVELGRSRFNPVNPGLLSRTTLTFRVSAPGRGSVRITDESGSLVNEIEIGPFATWEQRVVWEGRDFNDEIVEAGQYTLALAASGVDGANVVTSEKVEVDPTLVVHYRSLWGGFSGLSFAPTPEALPAATFQVTAQGAATLYGPSDGLPDRYPIRLGLRAGLGAGFEIGAYGGLIPTEEPTETRWNAGGSLLFARSISDAQAPAALTIGGLLTGVYQSPRPDGRYAAPDTFAAHVGIALATPMSLNSGPFTATVAPEYRLSPAPISYTTGTPPENDWTHYAYLRAGVLYDVAGLMVGASAVLRRGIDEPEVIPLQTGLDVAYVIPRSPVALSLQVLAEWDGSGGGYVQSGLGFGLLF